VRLRLVLEVVLVHAQVGLSNLLLLIDLMVAHMTRSWFSAQNRRRAIVDRHRHPTRQAEVKTKHFSDSLQDL
jgi:hypothetical protein